MRRQNRLLQIYTVGDPHYFYSGPRHRASCYQVPSKHYILFPHTTGDYGHV